LGGTSWYDFPASEQQRDFDNDLFKVINNKQGVSFFFLLEARLVIGGGGSGRNGGHLKDGGIVSHHRPVFATTLVGVEFVF
jgi:hypothetical protein